MTPGTEIDPASGASAQVASAAPKLPNTTKPAWIRRRGITGALAAFGVVAMAGAVIAPTGMALAEQPPDDTTTVFSLAVEDTQDLTVSVEGATIVPVERGSFEVYVKPKPKPKPAPAAAPTSTSTQSSSNAPSPVFYTGGGAPAEWMAAAGIASSDWGYVDYIVSKESGWNPNAYNASSGASGLVQALPCGKVPGNCFDPVDSLRWGNSYAVGRYGSWASAYAFWSANHWW